MDFVPLNIRLNFSQRLHFYDSIRKRKFLSTATLKSKGVVIRRAFERFQLLWLGKLIPCQKVRNFSAFRPYCLRDLGVPMERDPVTMDFFLTGEICNGRQPWMPPSKGFIIA
jgi:hypothetical protein